MADPRKTQTLVVVVVILGYLSVPACCFTQDIQQYTQEISKRSFAIMDGLLDSEGLLMKIGSPIFTILVFCSALKELFLLLTTWIPSLGGLVGLGGPLAMLAGFPSQEMVQARNGTDRDQRFLDYVENQVRTSVNAGQRQFENELKKK